MHDIISFESGFYGLRVKSTGEIIDAALTRWDGRRGGGGYSYNAASDCFEYFQDAAGTVYYTDRGGDNARVWCSASRLAGHLRHLQQIAARH